MFTLIYIGSLKTDEQFYRGLFQMLGLGLFQMLQLVLGLFQILGLGLGLFQMLGSAQKQHLLKILSELQTTDFTFMSQIHEIKSESETAKLIQMTVSDHSPDLVERLTNLG